MCVPHRVFNKPTPCADKERLMNNPSSEAVRYPDLFQDIEAKWQARWRDADIYRADQSATRPKYYVLDMFPYPSGSGLHVGHCKNYVPGDVVARLMSMRGRNVLHPMGWDAFGQPAEQDAIKKNVNPRNVVPMLAKEYKRQMSLLGIGYDWNREINSTDPEYYRWNQWAFLHLYKRGLAYRKNAPVNWDPVDRVVLSNDEVADGKALRSGAVVEKRDMAQWFLRITAYGDKLIAGLDTIDWPEGVKTQQRDWIGKSEGCEFDLEIAESLRVPEDTSLTVRVFTTRVDTVYGMSFVVLSPEHVLVEQIVTDEQRAEVLAYRDRAGKLSEQDRTAEGRERTGVFTGAHAINPVNGHRVPVWIADYVLAGYGTGAIMAVPAHDERDFDFARRYNLPTPIVIVENESDVDNPPSGSDLTAAFVSKEGYTVNSGVFSGLPAKVAAKRITEQLVSKGIGEAKTNFRLRDWLVSRQRYWGTPIPIIHCKTCGEVPVPEDQLPVLLPDVENYKPGPDGRSPLASIPEFVNTICPKCGAPAERETDTMAGSVDSSWYFLRFTSPHEHTAPWNRESSDYWMNVDRYLGGREHAVGHLLYARFFQKVFFDAGLVSKDEPFQSLRNQGMLLGYTPVDADTEDKKSIRFDELPGYNFAEWTERYKNEGAFMATRRVKQLDETYREEPVRIEFQWLKMSKSKGNSVTPDEIAEKYGADSLRLYVCFEAPFEDTIQWDETRMNGTYRFLSRVYDSVTEIAPSFDRDWASKVGDATSPAEKDLRRKTHQAIAKVGSDIESLGFNTAVSALMIFADALRKFVAASGFTSPAAHEAAETLCKLLAPLAPHIADELFEKLGYTGRFLYREPFPVYEESVAAEAEVTVVVQVNGKIREKLVLPADSDAKVCEMSAMASEKVQADLAGKTVRKVIVVPGKLVNIVAN